MSNKNYKDKRTEANENGQIIKIHASNSFFEVMAPTNDFYSVRVNFVEYDKNSHKQTKFVSIFFQVYEFVGFLQRIINREVKAMMEWDKQRCQAAGLKFSDLQLSPNFEKDKRGNFIAMQRGSENKEGVTMARHFWMCSGSNADIIFNAKTGPGETFGNGTVKFKSGAPTETVRVPMTYAVLENMAQFVMMRLTALETSLAVKGVYNKTEIEDGGQPEAEATPTPAPTAPAPEQAPTPAPAQAAPAAEPTQAPAQETVVHVITGTFTSDFQALNGAYVANMNIKGKEYPIYFRGDVPNALRKAQSLGTEVSINVFQKNGKIGFDSLI